MHKSIEFVESSAFTKYLPEYLTDEEYRPLQAELASNPELGDLMPGTAGNRRVSQDAVG